MVEPKLRFKADDGSDFPNWEEKVVEDVCSVTTGNSNTQDRVDGGQYPFYIRSATPVRSNRYLFDTEAVITIGDGQVGQVFHYVKGKFDLHQRCYAMFDFKENIIGKYFYYFFSSHFYKRVMRMSAKATVDSVRREMITKMSLQLPSLPEQRKIADLLSAVDAVITAQQAEVDAWEQRKKGVMQKLFSQEVRFKADDGSDFPDWEEKTLGDLGEFIKGAPLSKADIAPEGNPMILYGELYTTYGEVAYEIARSTNRNVDDKYRSKIGDVLIPTSGETPEEISTATCVMKEGVILAGDLYIYRTVDEIDGRIMSYLLNHQANKAISCIAQGKSVVHVQAKELRNITVVFPLEMGEQRKIADCLASMDEVIQKAKDELAKWQELKKGLLQQMFV